jgi:hypothetical protein
VASTTSTRLWRVHKAAGKPFPDFTDDDVMNYLITEATFIKANREDAEAHKKAEHEAKMKQMKEEAKEELKKMFPGGR